MKVFYKIVYYFILVALVIGLAFYFEGDLNLIWQNLQKNISPCGQPLAYTIGDFDAKFGLSREELLESISQAALIWSQGLGKPLFDYSENAGLKVNLIYDARQDSAVKLKKLGLNISRSKASYEALKAKYETFDKTYNRQKIELDNAINYYQQETGNYEAEVRAANKRGGAGLDEFDILEQERKSLNDLASSIKLKQNAINKIVDDLNALANVINRLIYELNLNVSHYNTIGASTAVEFQEGVYQSDAMGERINIYQFDNQEMLIRVLAHELGHALGLEHLDNPRAIMYRLNESGNDKITADDLAELKKICKVK